MQSRIVDIEKRYCWTAGHIWKKSFKKTVGELKEMKMEKAV
jgi:hypothetical protein